jgi:carbamoyl-phosphate synthase small subunit
MLVRHVRNKGAMNAIISSELSPDELEAELKKVPSMEGLELATQVSTQEVYFVGEEDAPYKVSVLDLGIKQSILKNLAARGCYCKVFPAKTSYDEMAVWNPDGYFISNGPGDPAVTEYAVDTVSKILEKDAPIFGICLGHQILAEAVGITTYKMHHGHRGLNHPVINLETGLSEMTSQNHGFVINAEDVEKSDRVIATHKHLNDHSIAGIKVADRKAFSVQYHPESSPGPHDSRYLFDQFVDLMKNNK